MRYEQGTKRKSVRMSRRLLAQHIPLQRDSVALCEYITSRISAEQHSLVKMLRGEKAINDHLLDTEAVDDIKEELSYALQEACGQVADGILAKLLIQTTTDCVARLNLTEDQLQSWVQIESPSYLS